MVWCAAPNCSNSTTRGFRLFIFPRDKARRARWLQNCGRKNWQPTEHSKLCEVHFEESQFELKRADGRKLLKWNAIPTLFEAPNPPPQLQSKRKAPKQREPPKDKSTTSVPPSGDGYVPTPRKQRVPNLDNCLNPEIVIVESIASWDPGSPGASVCEDPLQNEDAEPSYDEEVLKTVKEQLCRICGMKRDNLLSIFSTVEACEGDMVTLSKKIQLYLPLEVDIEDGLPPNICMDCHAQIDSWHEMHTTAVAADSLLRSMFTALKKEEVLLQKSNEDTRSDMEHLSDQVQDSDTKNNCDTELMRSTDMEISSDTLPDNRDNEEDISLHLQNNSDLIELEVREFLNRIEEKLQVKHDNGVEIKHNQPDCIQNDHMYARGRPVPTTCKFCRHRLSCKVLGEDGFKQGNYGNLTCTCNKKERRNYKIVEKFRELLGNLGEKIVKERKTVNKERISDAAKSPSSRENVNTRDKKWLLPVYTCVHCRQVFSHKKTGILHKKQCALEPAMCEICGRILKSRKELKDHRARHSQGGRTSCICEKCGKIFVTKAGLKTHIKNVHGEGTFVCEPCCKVFTTNARLGVHMKQHEKNKMENLNLLIKTSEQEGMFICPVCKAQFQDKKSVIIHMNERMKIRCLKCKGWILSERLSLTHKCSFTTCRFCSKRFLRTGGRYAHERLHTGEKPYTCKECGKAFASCATLINHRVTHKPPEYKCETCNKWFLRKTVYKDHMGFHAGIKHPCKFCSNVYNTRLALNKHNAKKHRDRMKSANHPEAYFIIEDFL